MEIGDRVKVSMWLALHGTVDGAIPSDHWYTTDSISPDAGEEPVDPV